MKKIQIAHLISKFFYIDGREIIYIKKFAVEMVCVIIWAFFH